MAAELLVESHSVFGVARSKNVVLVVGSGLDVERTFFLEAVPSVGFKHLCPKVGVVATSIFVAAEDVLEVWAAVTIFDDRRLAEIA